MNALTNFDGIGKYKPSQNQIIRSISLYSQLTAMQKRIFDKKIASGVKIKERNVEYIGNIACITDTNGCLNIGIYVDSLPTISTPAIASTNLIYRDLNYILYN